MGDSLLRSDAVRSFDDEVVLANPGDLEEERQSEGGKKPRGPTSVTTVSSGAKGVENLKGEQMNFIS